MSFVASIPPAATNSSRGKNLIYKNAMHISEEASGRLRAVYIDIRVFGDSKDKEELYKRIKENKDIKSRRIFAEALEPPLILQIIFGTITALIAIYNFLKEKKEKNIKVGITLPDGRVLTIRATNADDLQILINELAEK